MKNKNNSLSNNLFGKLSDEEAYTVTGGALAGVILGAVNGYCIGLVCAFVGSCVTSNWTYQDTKNMMHAGATVGAFLGGFMPV